MSDFSSVDRALLARARDLLAAEANDGRTRVALVRDQSGAVTSAFGYAAWATCPLLASLYAAIAAELTQPASILIMSSTDGITIPCRRCQQILADYCPDAHVVISSRASRQAWKLPSRDVCVSKDESLR